MHCLTSSTQKNPRDQAVSHVETNQNSSSDVVPSADHHQAHHFHPSYALPHQRHYRSVAPISSGYYSDFAVDIEVIDHLQDFNPSDDRNSFLFGCYYIQVQMSEQ
ncbi:unnamed protein product [Fusarium graminearum]|nr:unnamed protein product [Fusarium graminearum]